MTEYTPGKKIHFPWTGRTVLILAVDQAEQTVTFANPADLEDQATETIDELESADAAVLD